MTEAEALVLGFVATEGGARHARRVAVPHAVIAELFFGAKRARPLPHRPDLVFAGRAKGPSAASARMSLVVAG